MVSTSNRYKQQKQNTDDGKISSEKIVLYDDNILLHCYMYSVA